MVSGDAAYGLIENGAVVLQGEQIAWLGAEGDLPAEFSDAEPTDLDGRLVTPAPIDCHTHIVHGGNRAREFEMRLNGASYEEVARAGGGIISTVSATRGASEDDLVASALPRLDTLIGEGVTTVEIKSGYGLDEETELRMLRAARRLGTMRDVEIKTSFLGAHAVPPEFTGEADRYIDEVCIPALHLA
ncbi:MAG: imidazolonepropionase, partial [Pseudomonadota bacterium]